MCAAAALTFPKKEEEEEEVEQVTQQRPPGTLLCYSLSDFTVGTQPSNKLQSSVQLPTRGDFLFLFLPLFLAIEAK